jgi:FimV-like protein
MSLINDALKAAQRERLERTSGHAPPPFVERAATYSRSADRLPRAVIVAGVVITIVASATTAWLMGPRSSSPARRAAVAPQNATSKPSTNVTLQPAQPVAETKASPHPQAPRLPLAGPSPNGSRQTKSAVPRRLEARSSATPSVPVRKSTIDSGKLATDAASPAAAPAQSNVASLGTAQVKLVMDQTGSRPADSLARLAYAEHVKNNLEHARDLYERAIATKQAPAEAFNNYGVLLAQQGNATMATEMFRQAIARDESNVDAWVNLGDSFVAAGHHGSALSAFDRARQLDPSRASIKIRLAAEYLEIGDTTGARRVYEEVVRTHPDDARAHHAYGTFLQASKDYRGAIREFDRFIETAEKSPGEVTPEKIAEMRRHVASLRRVTP